jgi:hypothetical protein
LVAVRDLAKSASDEELAQLCRLMTLKLEDASDKVRVPARQTFVASIFDYAKSPSAVLLSVMSIQNVRPKWFGPVFKEAYLRNQEPSRTLISQIVSQVSTEPNKVNAALILELCECLPGVCVDYHPQLIAALNKCQDPRVLLSLPSALNAT